jgi:hypothetical protein
MVQDPRHQILDEWFESFKERAATLTDQYRAAEPFPHVVMENFFDPVQAGVLDYAIRKTTKVRWTRFHNKHEKKLATLPGRGFAEQSPLVRSALAALNDPRMVEALSVLTGIKDLRADPMYLGGGIHKIERGGYLKIHADFNRHPLDRDFRRLNLLVYLNDKWEEEWGGHLELWDKPMENCVQKIAPILNRAVLFDTGQTSWHGHPHPLECPTFRHRISLATYYYAPDPGPQRVRPHSTRFQRTPR